MIKTINTKLRKAEAFSMPKLLLVLVFAVVGGVYIFNDFGSSFNKQSSKQLYDDLQTIDQEGKKNIINNKSVGLNDYKSTITDLKLGSTNAIKEVMVTDNNNYIFSGSYDGDTYNGANMSGYQTIMDKTLDNGNIVLNIVYQNDVFEGISSPIPIGTTPLEGNSFGEPKKAGFNVDKYYLVFSNDSNLPEQLKSSTPAYYKTIKNMKAYSGSAFTKDIQVLEFNVN